MPASRERPCRQAERPRAPAVERDRAGLERHVFRRRPAVLRCAACIRAACIRAASIRAASIRAVSPGVAGLGAAWTAAQELHALGIDLGGAALLTFLVFPFPRLDATLDVDASALREVLGAQFTRSPHTTMRCHSVRSTFSPLALSVQVSLVARVKLTTACPFWV